jgi:GGDEF domain-containing protein
MIQLNPFLRTQASLPTTSGTEPDPGGTNAIYRVLSTFMQGIAFHSLPFDEAAFAAFQRSIWKLRASFEISQEEDGAAAMAAATVRLMEEYNEAAKEHLRIRQDEYSEVLGGMIQSLAEVTQAGPHTVTRMRSLARDLGGASDLASFSVARAKLEASVAELRVRAQVSAGKPATGRDVVDETDAVTGLPDAGCAVGALGRIWSRRNSFYLGVFSLEFLETINARFGFRVGDELLSLLGQEAAQRLPSPDQLFRWRGPSVVALAERQVPESMVASEFGRAVPPRLEIATMVREREAMVRASTTWTMFRLSEVATLEEAVSRMNEFTGGRSVYLKRAAASS